MNITEAPVTSHRDIKKLVCAPELATPSKGMYAFGLLLRLTAGMLAILGLLLFFCDAFRLDVPQYVNVIITVVFTLFFSLFYFKKAGALISGVMASIGAALLILLCPDGIRTIPNGIYALYNAIMRRLSSSGYRSLKELILKTKAEDDTLVIFGVGILGFILAAIIINSLIRKTRILPILFSGLTIITFVFTYTSARTNWGFSMILTSLCGVLSLKMYDSVFAVTDVLAVPVNRRAGAGDDSEEILFKIKVNDGEAKRSALGGYAAGAAMLIAAAVLIIPTLKIHSSWTYIESIDHRLQYMRAVISSITVGDTPNLNDLGFLGNMDTLNARDTNATKRSFNGKALLELHSSYNWPIYLRSWSGAYFIEDTWYSAVTDEVDEYRKTFGENFSSDSLIFSFYEVAEPNITELSSLGSYSAEIDSGFILVTTDLRNINSNGNLLFLPTFTNPDVGLLEFGADENLPYKTEYKNYFDGILTTSWFNFNKQYRTVSLIPTYRSRKVHNEIEDFERIYEVMRYYICFLEDEELTEEEEIEYIAMAKETLSEMGISTKKTALEYFFTLNDKERTQYIYDHFTLPELYSEYANKLYTTVNADKRLAECLNKVTSEILSAYNTESPVVVDLFVESNELVVNQTPSATSSINWYANKLVTYENGSPKLDTHLTTMAIIDWLKDNCTYTLEPRQPNNKRISALEAFLTDTKEGYCVQFASSAALMLRNLGIPARYCEGYIANGFRRDTSDSPVNRYICTIRDYNAHAWIEVWNDNIGWMQYECTPEYYDTMYKLLSSTSSSSSSGSFGTEPIMEDIGDDALIDIAISRRAIDVGVMILLIAVIVLSVAAAATVVILIIRFRNQIETKAQRRAEVISLSIRGDLTEEDGRIIGAELVDYIMTAWKVAGFEPALGELPSEFAIRAAEGLEVTGFYDHTFPEIMEAIERECYGNGMTRAQIKMCGEYLLMLRTSVSESLSPFDRYINERIKITI